MARIKPDCLRGRAEGWLKPSEQSRFLPVQDSEEFVFSQHDKLAVAEEESLCPDSSLSERESYAKEWNLLVNEWFYTETGDLRPLPQILKDLDYLKHSAYYIERKFGWKVDLFHYWVVPNREGTVPCAA